MTVSLPTETRAAIQEAAEAEGVPVSALVNRALEAFTRGRLLDAWLREYEARRGAFDEEELRALAEESGIPYIPPSSTSAA